MPCRVLQLTDLHLFANSGERLVGVPTRQSLLDVCEFIETQAIPFDQLVVTGDLAHDELAETYEWLRQTFSKWLGRCRIVPGNHDSRDAMRQVFPDLVPSATGPITFAQPAGAWRLIGLDTHVPGEVPGRIGPDQLAWLEEQLISHSAEPTLLFMHHPPVEVGCDWLDRIGLEEPEALLSLIGRFEQVRVISAGHVHHVFEGKAGNAAVVTTPSTAVQFLPQGAEPVYDPIPPGFRVFTLDADNYRTEVIRLPRLAYPPQAVSRN